METTTNTLSNWAWYWVGYLGILLYVLFAAYKSGDTTFERVWDFCKANAVAIMINILCYTALAIMWMWEGVSFMGLVLERGVLGPLVILVAMGGTPLLKALFEARTQRATALLAAKTESDGKAAADPGAQKT